MSDLLETLKTTDLHRRQRSSARTLLPYESINGGWYSSSSAQPYTQNENPEQT